MAPRNTRKNGQDLPCPTNGSLSHYFKQISSYSPLSSKEEGELSVRIRQGDREALEKLVLANLRFVVSVSHTYKNQGLPLADLINEGNLGLIRAAKRFDERKNFKFISYAVWWIRQGILQALAEQSRIVRLPVNRVCTIHKMGEAERRLQQKRSRSPNMREIADELGIRESDVQRMARIGNRHVSLDAPLGNERGGVLYDKLSSEDESRTEDAFLRQSLRKELSLLLDQLCPREREVVALYYGIGEDTAYTLDEIGKRLAITRERVRQIKEAALRKLKDPSVNRRLRSYY
jgi:RNA polymerase primary sigma factor